MVELVIQISEIISKYLPDFWHESIISQWKGIAKISETFEKYSILHNRYVFIFLTPLFYIFTITHYFSTGEIVLLKLLKSIIY